MKKYQGTLTLEVLEGADNYNNWIASRIKPFIKSPALEIGAGTGNISAYFSNIKNLTLTDVDPNLSKKLLKKFTDKKNINIETLNIESKFTKVKNKFNSVFLVNVLEHIKNDQLALSNINSLLERKGRVSILVPAKKFAYNNLDKSLGHVRRYEKKELREKLEKGGFKIIYLEYFNIIGLLSWMIRDKITKNEDHLKPYQVKMFDVFVPFLSLIEPKKGLPVGISLIAVGEKNE